MEFETGQPDKFAPAELSSLRAELMQSGLDSWQAGELVSAFLSGRGYGVSPQAARHAATRIEAVGCSIECMQEVLSGLAIAV